MGSNSEQNKSRAERGQKGSAGAAAVQSKTPQAKPAKTAGTKAAGPLQAKPAKSAKVKSKRQPREHNVKAQGVAAYSGIMVLYMFATVVTKVIGFGREIFITARFGYGTISDGYILGFSVPDLVYSLLVGGAVTAAVTPILASAIERNEEKKVWHSISTFYTLILSLSFVLLTAGTIFSGDIIRLLNAGKEPAVLEVAAAVSKIIFLQTFFFILISIINSILSAYKVFGLPVFGDSIYNLVCLLAIALLGAPTLAGASRVAWGVVAAALCYFLYMAYFAKPYLGNFKPNFDVRNPLFKRILFLAIPPVIAGTVAQLTLITKQSYADQFTGAVTSLRNATTLYYLPYQIIISSIGPLMLPNLSGFLARGADKEASDFYTKAIKTVLFMLLPCVIFFALCSEETVRAVYQWDPSKYTEENVRATASLLRILSVNMIIECLIFFINQVFFARQRSWISLLTGIMTLVLTPFFCHIYINVFNLGLASLTLATCSYNLIILLVSHLLKKHFAPEVKMTGLLSFITKALVAAFFSFSILLLLRGMLPLASGKFLQLVQYAFYGVLILGFYFMAAVLLRMPEAQAVLRMLTDFAAKIFRRRRV